MNTSNELVHLLNVQMQFGFAVPNARQVCVPVRLIVIIEA